MPRLLKKNKTVIELTDLITNVEELINITKAEFTMLQSIPCTLSLNDSDFWCDTEKFSINQNFSLSGNPVFVFTIIILIWLIMH
ncbi:MAG: hypothetical protein MK105_07775 [Crocinitomicaceae bacterium]|nr:hypothetical protein [Crocinitomicaceae bacterium]